MVRALLDHSREVLDGPAPSLVRRLRDVVPAAIDVLERLWVVDLGVDPRRLSDHQLDLQRPGDLLGDLAGEGEQRVRRRLPSVRGHDVDRGHVDQLGVDPQLIAQLMDAGLEHVVDTGPLATGLVGGVDDIQCGDAGEPVHDLGHQHRSGAPQGSIERLGVHRKHGDGG